MRTAAGVSDGDLVRAIRAREPGAAESAESELDRRFAPRVRLYGLRHLRDEDAARDLVQQALLVTIEKLREHLDLTLSAAGGAGAELGRYALEHER